MVLCPHKHVNSAVREQTLMSILLKLPAYSQSRGLPRPHHLDAYLRYYLCTSWQELLCVCLCVCRNVFGEQRPRIGPTQREWGPLEGEQASVWRLKIEYRVWDECSQADCVESFCQKGGVFGEGAFNNSHCCAMRSAACKWSPEITQHNDGSRNMHCTESDMHFLC